MSGTVTQVSSSEAFYTTIKSSSLTVVDFFAVWCGPCKAISPFIEKLAAEYPNVTFIKVDVDGLAEVSQDAGVRAMPTFQFYKNGKKVGEVVGANPNALKAGIEKNL